MIGKRLFFVVVAGHVFAQTAPPTRTAEWVTSGADAQRSHWIPNDPKISVEGMQTPGFQFLWKSKLGNDALAPAILMDRYIGYRGFRSFAFVASSSNTIYALDSDLNRIEWQKRLGEPATLSQTSCAGAVPAIARSITLSYPAFGNVGRVSWAHSDVGAAGEGAVTLPAALRAAAAALLPPPVRPSTTTPPRPPSGPRASVIYMLAGGVLHTLNVSNGDDVVPPIEFVPRDSIAQGLTVVDNFAYAVTRGCNGGHAALWALDLATKQTVMWNPPSGDIAGTDGLAFGPDGTIYVATGGSLVAFSAKTLVVKSSYEAPAEFATSPVVFGYKGRNFVAAATRDGSVRVIDSTSPSAAVLDASSSSAAFPAGTLASWQSLNGARWLIATSSSSISAWKIVERDGDIALEPTWMKKTVSPLPPMIINGVVFVVSSGQLNALDGTTGKALWDSGKTIAGVASGGITGGASQIYLSTSDGTIYAFGFPIEH